MACDKVKFELFLIQAETTFDFGKRKIRSSEQNRLRARNTRIQGQVEWIFVFMPTVQRFLSPSRDIESQQRQSMDNRVATVVNTVLIDHIAKPNDAAKPKNS